jgi:hypothetical protein
MSDDKKPQLACGECGNGTFGPDVWIRAGKVRLYGYECRQCGRLTYSLDDQNPAADGVVLAKAYKKES